jgi:hypothetical protein
MKNAIISIAIAVFIGCCTPLLHAKKPVDLTETMKESLVYLEASCVSWEQLQPWRQTPAVRVGTYGCAVGPYQILTIARPLADTVMIQARRYGQNEYIPATIKVIDYEFNLCLVEIQKTEGRPPLKPLKFEDKYQKSKDLKAYWLSPGGQLSTARATLDRADVLFSNISFVKNLQYILTNPSRATGTGEVYFWEKNPIGLACWSSDTEAGLIPAETINRFLAQTQNETFGGFGAVGFKTSALLDPAVRKHLKMPADLTDGVYITSVFTMGTGSAELKPGDVLLSLSDQPLNPYGRYLDKRYDRIGFDHLIAKEPVGSTINAKIWRNEKEESVDIIVRNIDVNDMLVQFYLYNTRPEYLIFGGFVFQKLSRNYLSLWGDSWQGKAPPHLYRYYQDYAFCPTDRRSDIVLLSYVLPTESNLGYQQLGRLVIKSLNGKQISGFSDMNEALKLNPESNYHVIESELDFPTIVIPKAQLTLTDQQVMQLYGIQNLSYIENHD